MITHLAWVFLISISPLGEARVGIPYGIIRDVNPVLVFLVGLSANLLVYPLLTFLIDKFDTRFWKYKSYRRQSIKLARRAKSGIGERVQKYGFWGLMLFVMIPLPVTGAYMGTIAAHVFKVKRSHALLAISLGVIISCMIVAFTAHYGKTGVERM
ncbi:COG2426 family protein [Halocola ammonii]